MTTDQEMPALTEDIQSDSSSDVSFTDDENETMPGLESDHAYDSYDSDDDFITEENESTNTSSDDIQASITLRRRKLRTVSATRTCVRHQSKAD